MIFALGCEKNTGFNDMRKDFCTIAFFALSIVWLGF